MELVNKTQKSWDELKDRLNVQQMVSGRVIRQENYGIFVDIGEKFEGLVLAPYISNNKYLNLDEYPKVGEVIKAFVLALLEDRDIKFRYIYLTMREPPGTRSSSPRRQP